MTKTTPDVPGRAFEMALDLPASPDDVWRALTAAEELVRWFPVDARVTPGPGGSMVWSWGENWDWATRIDAWEPGRLLRLVQEDARPYDAEGSGRAAGELACARGARQQRVPPRRAGEQPDVLQQRAPQADGHLAGVRHLRGTVAQGG